MKRLLIALTALALIATPALADFPDDCFGPDDVTNRTEVTGCGGCHVSPDPVPHMVWVADGWKASEHACSYESYLGNTYCASCHSPFQADPLVLDTHDTSTPVALEDWQHVTCAACHLGHTEAGLVGTRMGNYDVEGIGDGNPAAPGYFLRYLDEDSPDYDENAANDLCMHCHTGWRHAPDFQGFGNAMLQNGVHCIDCHMADVPTDGSTLEEVTDETPFRHSHDFKVEAHLPWSCGTVPGGCHDNHTEDWARKQIQKGRIHGKPDNHDNGGGND